MTFHFNDFDTPDGSSQSSAAQDGGTGTPPASHDAALEALTGCPIHRSIEAACEEPGCPNNPAGAEQIRIQPEGCLRAEDPLPTAAPIWMDREARVKSIYQTEPKNNRCVM